MEDPLMCAVSGNSYEREAMGNYVAECLSKQPTDPLTKQAFEMRDLVPNRGMQQIIQEWRTKSYVSTGSGGSGGGGGGGASGAGAGAGAGGAGGGENQNWGGHISSFFFGGSPAAAAAVPTSPLPPATAAAVAAASEDDGDAVLRAELVLWLTKDVLIVSRDATRYAEMMLQNNIGSKRRLATRLEASCWWRSSE
jgi:hypothetical protein